MLVTRISQQAKNPNRANIFIDGKYSFSLDLNQVLETKIKVGVELDEAELKKFQKLSSDGKLKIRTLEWLTLRPHSKKELVDYLKRKKLEIELIEVWVRDFQKMGYQNDENFTKWWIEQRQNKQKSSRYIQQELYSKGISSDVVNELLNHSDGDRLVISKLIVKKRQLSKYKDDQKLIEYLLRQGFSYSLIKEVLAEE